MHQNKLSFKQRKFFLMQIASTNAKNMFVNFWDFFYMFDVYCSLSKGIINSDLVFPRFNKNKTFNIKNFYHLKLSTPVKNSIDFKNNNIISSITNINNHVITISNNTIFQTIIFNYFILNL